LDYYTKQYNNDIPEKDEDGKIIEKKFSMLSTKDQKKWIIRRIS
jgi:hypothetical protein